MSTLSDILAILDKWPAWKRVKEAPERIDQLEQRIAALEASQKKPSKRGGKECEYCGEFAVRLVREEKDKIFGDLGGKKKYYRCDSCGQETDRLDTGQ